MRKELRKELIPGLVLLFLVGWGAQFLAELVQVGGKHVLEASAVAIVIGICIRNLGALPQNCKSGVAAFEKLLILGVVLMGVSLDIHTVKEQGVSILAIIVTIMAASYALIFLLGKAFSLSETLSVLLAVGTTICGTSAIAITAPLIQAKEEETSYAVATIALFGLIAVLVYPLIGQWLGVSDLHFGVFAGTAIHSTPQVVGAGLMFSDLAGNTATAVKLIRNCFMAPLALIIAYWWNKKEQVTSVSYRRAFPWFLFGYFVMAALSTLGCFSPEQIKSLSDVAKFLVLVAMGGIGLSTQLSSFRSVGLKPLFVGFLGSVVVAVVSSILIIVFL